MRALPLLLLLACSSVDPDLYARTRRELARMQSTFQKMEPAPQEGTPVPVPWNKGQYAVWAITQGEHTTLLSAQVEEADAAGVQLMLVSLSPKLRTTARLSFSRQPHTLDEARTLLTQVIRRRGDELTFTYRFGPDVRDEMRDSLMPLWATLVPSPEQGAAQTVTTPAATLQGALPAHALLAFKHAGLEVDGFIHPAVPITGLASAKAVHGKETVELMEYGWAGDGPQF